LIWFNSSKRSGITDPFMDNRLEQIDLLYDKLSTPTRKILHPFLPT
jgi:hypothetical protein